MKIRVLIVEDNADAANSLATLLGLLGHEVKIAAEGPTALRLAAAAPPDAALVDIGLPGMNGYEVAQRLRAACADIVLVALTGYGRDEDRQKAFAVGFQHHLVKPVDLDALDALLRQLSSGSAARKKRRRLGPRAARKAASATKLGHSTAN